MQEIQTPEAHIAHVFDVLILPSIKSLLNRPNVVRGPIHVVVIDTDSEYIKGGALPTVFEILHGEESDWKGWNDTGFKGVAYMAAQLSWLTKMSMRELVTYQNGVLYNTLCPQFGECKHCGTFIHEGFLVVVNGFNEHRYNDMFAAMFSVAIDMRFLR